MNIAVYLDVQNKINDDLATRSLETQAVRSLYNLLPLIDLGLLHGMVKFIRLCVHMGKL